MPRFTGLVPTAPREHAGPRSLAPVVGHDVGPPLGRVQGAVHASPVSNREDVHLLQSNLIAMGDVLQPTSDGLQLIQKHIWRN